MYSIALGIKHYALNRQHFSHYPMCLTSRSMPSKALTLSTYCCFLRLLHIFRKFYSISWNFLENATQFSGSSIFLEHFGYKFIIVHSFRICKLNMSVPESNSRNSQYKSARSLPSQTKQLFEFQSSKSFLQIPQNGQNIQFDHSHRLPRGYARSLRRSWRILLRKS